MNGIEDRNPRMPLSNGHGSSGNDAANENSSGTNPVPHIERSTRCHGVYPEAPCEEK